MMNKILVVDCRTSDKSLKKLLSMGYSIIYMPESRNFDEPICAHPDIFVAKINDKLFVDKQINSLFTFTENLIICDREADCNTKISYPSDIMFNCVSVGNNLICYEKHTHNKIIDYAKITGMNIIDVKQGYAKCSTCVVGENAIITEDESISKAAKAAGIDVLKLQIGSVELEGYNYGFIGGASGLIENDLLAFNGDITRHPEYDKICAFCRKHGTCIVSLCDEKLYDIGSIIRI